MSIKVAQNRYLEIQELKDDKKYYLEQLDNYITTLEEELFFLEDGYMLDDRESNRIDFIKETIECLKYIYEDCKEIN